MKSQRIDWFVLDQLWNNIYSYIPAAGRFDSFSTRPTGHPRSSSIFAPGTFIFSNKVSISSWGEAEGWKTKPSLKNIMSQGANDAFSTKGKKCCVFPFLPYTERDEKRSFLPAGGKRLLLNKRLNNEMCEIRKLVWNKTGASNLEKNYLY